MRIKQSAFKAALRALACLSLPALSGAAAFDPYVGLGDSNLGLGVGF